MPSMEHIGKDIWVKQCTRCDTEFKVIAWTWNEARELMLKHFSPNMMHNRSDEMQSHCKSCNSNLRHRRHNGPLTFHRDALLEQQSGKCFLCSKEIKYEDKSANIDHDHTTGQTRKVLCRLCNLWMAAVDDEKWLEKAIAYRDSFRCE